MEKITINGVDLYLTEETAEELRRELEEERQEKRKHWMLWHWYARRWAMYGDEESGGFFSDLYKDERGFRPTWTRDEVFFFLYGRKCWIQHGIH